MAHERRRKQGPGAPQARSFGPDGRVEPGQAPNGRPDETLRETQGQAVLSPWDRWRHVALQMNGWIHAAVLFFAIAALLVSLRPAGPDSADGLIASYFARCSNASRDWAYVIDNCTVSASDLAIRWRVAADRMPSAGETERPSEAFARDQFETDLLVHACRQSHCERQDAARVYIENAMRHAAADYYLLEHTPPEIRTLSIAVTDEEVERIYRQNRSRYAGLDASPASVRQAIRSVLSQEKLARRSQAMVLIRQKVLDRVKDATGPRFRGEGTRSAPNETP